MFAWLAAALFLISFLISGGGLAPSTPWLHPVTLIAAGLTLAMVHAAGIGPNWPRRG